MVILKEQWLIVTQNINNTGDFYAKLGNKIKQEDFSSTEAFGIGERNDRGDRLIKFAKEQSNHSKSRVPGQNGVSQA